MSTALRSYRLGVISGDGIGPEIVDSAPSVLEAVAGLAGSSFDLVEISGGAGPTSRRKPGDDQHLRAHQGTPRQGLRPYPYILLKLFSSMLAGVQAAALLIAALLIAALLIAAKRADAIASEIALHTERSTDDIKVLLRENTELTSGMKQNTDLLGAIHLHVANIGRAVGAELGNFPPGDVPAGS